jgi:acyl-CoA synthetase (AMP-forming)/AMP-acid ligase II
MTVHQAFAQTCEAFGRNPFLYIDSVTAAAYGIGEEEIAYAEAGAVIERLVERYRRAGYGPGHRVGLLLENRPDFFMHWLALNALGVSVVPLNPNLRPAELAYLVQDSEIILAVAPEARLPILRDVMSHTSLGLALATPDALPAGQVPAPIGGRVGPESECALLYTSGTTSKPKGCVLSNAYFLAAGRWYIEAGGLCTLRVGEDRLLTPLPMVHMNAMAFSTMAMIMAGGCIIPLDRFHPTKFWESVRTSRASIVHYLGVMPAMLLQSAPSLADRDHQVRFGFGAGVDRRLHAEFEERFGFPLVEAWAMTETGAGACIVANRKPRHVGTNCFGRPTSAVEVRIIDDDGREAEEGELLVRAAGCDGRRGFFAGYLKDPALTEQAWADGCFHTGDVVRRGADGSLFFVDRKKNVVRRSGENIAAVEVESVLRGHPDIRDVAVAATPDELRGEEVLACIVPRAHVASESRTALAQSIVRWALQELSYHKVPGWVAFVDRLPLTATEKLNRGELKSMARTLPGTPACIDTRFLKRPPG